MSHAAADPPASSTSTFASGFSLNLLASTEPADPEPTTMKSYLLN